METRAGGAAGKHQTIQLREIDEFPYITVAQATSELLADDCIVTDPGRRGIFYALHEDSTPEEP
jgi:hypothetical protein